MYFYYSNCNNPVLKKPIIIFDGFDPDDERKEYDIYDLMNYEFSLADNLRAKGFDVVIVNFPTGADYIVRNAYAVIKVIKWVNQHKTTDNKLVIVGPSMGGLISRYALAKMEKNGEDHETGLWISFDSPHQGANISIGDQEFLRFFGHHANNAGAIEGLDKINSPAAKQMLLDHYSKPWNHEKPLSNYYRNIFINELTNNGIQGSNGYPQNLRKIALINGSGIGTKQEGIDNSTYLLEMRKNFLGITVALGQVKTSADPSWHRWALYAYIADPSYWTQRWSRPGDSPYFTTSYDKAPGGNYPTQSILAEGNSDFTVYYPSHSFIPSVSALDLQNPYLTLNISNANIVQTNRTPFDDYYAPNENQEHITFSSQSVNWIKNQIGINSSISGPDIVCSSNKTFTLVNRPASSTVHWSKSSNLTFVSGQGTNYYKVRANGSGIGWVKAVVNLNGYNISYTKKISWVGKPNFTLEGETEVGVRMPGIAIIDYPGNQYQGVTNVNWTRSGAIATVNGYLTTGKFRAGSYPGYGSVYANATNVCGSKENRLLIEVTGGWYNIYPNPANSVLTVEIEHDKMSKEMQTKEVEIRLYDKLMIMKKHKVFKGNLIRLNLNDLKPDVYILQLKLGDKIFEEKIMHSY